MGQYDDVNREIQSFLASKGSIGQVAHESQANYSQHPPEHERVPDILPLLQSLLATYSEINRHLEAGHVEELKNTLLKSDIKMNLVCETLLETLKRTTEEKNMLLSENKDTTQKLRKMQEEEAVARVQRERIESDLELRRREVEELTRVVRDQKQRCEEGWKEVQRARSDAALLRVRVEELENLKMRAAERISVHEKEVSALSKIIKEKDDEIRQLMTAKSEEEGKNSGAKMRVVELERCIEVLNRKLETKEKSLTLCSNELSKLLAEGKAAKQEFEKHKETCGYYEKLYKSLDKQNAYLNSQLNNLLRSGDKEGLERMERYKKKARRNKRRAGKYAEEVKRLKEEIDELRDNSAIEGSDSLVKRIDELTGRNQEYRARIQALENEKKSIEHKIEQLESQRREGLLQRRYLEPDAVATAIRKDSEKVMERPHRLVDSKPWRRGSVGRIEPVSTSYKPINMPNGRSISSMVPTPLQYDYSIKPESAKNTSCKQAQNDYGSKPLRMFNLEHDYGSKPVIEIGGYVEEPSGLGPLFKTEPMRSPAEEQPLKPYPRVVDEPSAESVKTYQTTSTLKDMMARTDKLQKKFEALEEQLANIKEEDTAERLSEKVNTYSHNYSNWNVDSDDSDFI